MSLEKNKAVVRKMFEAINKQNLASLDELMTPDFVLHMHARQTRGWEVNKQVVEDEIKAFPDLHVAIEDIIAEGDKVCVRLKETATHTGEYRGLAPTGNKLSYTVVAIWRIVEGKIAEGWITYDQMDFLKQLGAIEWKGFPDELV
ncbi:MAG: ester cyclase [Candidatus Bathyarchaeia archaeon]